MPLYSGFSIPTNIQSVADSADKLLMVDSDSELFAITKEDFLDGISSTKEYFDNLVFLAHFNGEDNSTTITDVKGAVITRYGDSKISTAQSKFENGSLLLDGAGDYLSFPYSDAIDICGGDDFKLETWYYPLSVTGFRPIINQWRQVSGGGGFILASQDNALTFNFGAFSENSLLLSGGTLVLNTWHHIAVVRIRDRFTLWINGVNVSSAVSAATKILTAVNFSLGNYYNSGGTLGALGATDCIAHFNEMRITKPTRFAVNVPTQAFLDS